MVDDTYRFKYLLKLNYVIFGEIGDYFLHKSQEHKKYHFLMM